MIERQKMVAAIWVTLIASLFLLSQRFTIAYFWRIWNTPDHYYTHGPLAVILAALMVRMNWSRLRQTTKEASSLGLLPALAALTLQIIGTAIGFEQVAGFAFPLMLYGLLLSLFGTRVARILSLPLLFLVTAIPLPQLLLDSLTARYQLLSSFLAAHALQCLDHSIVYHGNVIIGDRLPAPLLVAPACSGLKLTIALIMCVSFLIYALQGTSRQKAVVAIVAIPLGALVNAARIVFIGWTAINSGSAVTITNVHNAGGLAGLAVCSAVLLGTASATGMRSFREILPSPNPELKPPVRYTVWPKATFLAVVCVSAVAVSAVAGIYADLPKGRINRSSVPLQINNWKGYEAPIDAITRKELNHADLLNLVYRNPSPAGQDIYVLIENAFDTNMLHDPRLCLIGGGGRLVDERTTRLSLRNSAAGADAWLLVSKAPDGGLATILCTYRVHNSYLATKNAVNAYAGRARLADLGRMISSPTQTASIKTGVRQREVTWYRFVTYSQGNRTDRDTLQRFAEKFLEEIKARGKQERAG